MFINNYERNTYRDIYELLEWLCQAITGTKNNKEILRNVTRYLSNCPAAMSSMLPFDEASIVSKIVHHLNTMSSSHGVSTLYSSLNPANIRNSANIYKSNCSLFLSLHEQMKGNILDQKQRTAILTFLLYMADSRFMHDNAQQRNRNSCRYFTNTQPSNSIRAHLMDKTHNLPIHNIQLSVDNTKVRQNVAGHVPQICQDGGVKEKNHCPFNQNIAVVNAQNAANAHHDNGIIFWDPHHKIHDDIAQNVIFSFTGIEGKFLKKDIVSGKFKLDLKAKTLNTVQAGMLIRLSELGYYHDLLQSFSDLKSGLSALGLMGQALVSAFKNEITKYYGMVAMLQEQLNRQKYAQRNSYNHAMIQADRLTLLKILVWAAEPLQRMKWLVTIAEASQEKKGGALASTVYDFLSNGNPIVKSLTRELLIALCGPFYQMLTRWLLEGEINDPYGEFFIECRNEVGTDRLWHDKYCVRESMLPRFISDELANKILVTGKSINFLCEVCEDKDPIKGGDQLHQCIEENAENIFAFVADTKLHAIIESIYFNTSKRVLDIVMGPHKLLEHLQAMRRYLLLGQGDFIGILMENLKSELDRPAKELYSYDLSTIMDAAIRSTNVQYDDPEVLNHLDVRLLTPCDGDIGWDILSLQYTVRGPLSTMLEPSMGVYQVLFKPLWRMKHMEFVLSTIIWKNQMCNAKPLRPMSCELNKILYRLHLFTAEIMHFIHQMQYYILFEVIECSWADLQASVQDAKTLDEILLAHDNFLNAIKCGVFLDSNSGELSQHLETVYDGIKRLEVWQGRFFEICFTELNSRKQYREFIIKSEEIGEFGLTSVKQLERDQEHKIFEQNIASYQKSLSNIACDYEKAVRCFLLALNSNNDHNLQLFGIRLDFNEYYKKRDQRLSVPLTFEHMRMSNVFFSNKSMLGSSRYTGIN